jgi:hypothetical protein
VERLGVDGYAHACAAIARHVVPWAQEQFGLARSVGDGPRAPSGAGSIPAIDAYAEPLPRLRPEVTARWRDRELVVGVLGAGSELGITPLTLEALALFDGVTTIGAAAAALAPRTPAGIGLVAGSLADLRSVVLGLHLAESDTNLFERPVPTEEVLI